MIVKVQWTEHDRVYTVGISKFLAALGYDVHEPQIKAAAAKLLSQEEMTPSNEPTTHRERTT